MLVSLIGKEKIKSIILPNECYGIYWIFNSENSENEKELISVEAKDNKWILTSNDDASIIDNNVEIKYKELEDYKFYNVLDKKNNFTERIYCEPTYSQNYKLYKFVSNNVTIGADNTCGIYIDSKIIGTLQIAINCDENKHIFMNISGETSVYINDFKVAGGVELVSGDNIFINGIRIIFVRDNDDMIFMINDPYNGVSVSSSYFLQLERKPNTINIDTITDEEAVLYSENDFFFKKPRFKENITKLSIAIDPPPMKQQKSDMPVLLVVGPMVTSSAISLLYGYMTISNLIKNGNKWSQAMPSFLICIFSLMTTLGWPFIIRWYTKHKYKKHEKVRVKKYNEYIKKVLNQINESATNQQRILLQNSPSLEECKKAIETRDINFWSRKDQDEDFLSVSVGYGNVPMQIDLKIPEVHFALEEDELSEGMSKLQSQLPILTHVPIAYNFLNKKVTATIGDVKLNKKFIDQIIFQLVTLHSYDDLKIVILSNDAANKDGRWNYAKILPHVWNNEKNFRFFGTNKDEIREICYYLDNIYTSRVENNNTNNSKNKCLPFYLIITDDYKVVRNFDFIKKFLGSNNTNGFGLLIMNDKVFNLPATCDNFINVSSNVSEIFQNVLNSNVQKFNIDFETQINMYNYSKILANIPIEIDDKDDGSLPSKIGFLELYDVGKIEQLNILNRWRESNPMISLQSLIGLGKGGEKIYLDLHEKYHGPHGLIAGMTGSGKSEFIATYILSLAINYHPNEVQFILIDYKGGGLAGIFENKTTGIKLPHLIGTITNLDENEIKRSLESIESEIKRRQIIFSQVREQLGDSVIDIYKYQQLYRDGMVSQPVSHLFIICDEFAELKAQQPEFLSQLISISRIGRSLGIHLILATQKPSGVVDNQIWSNSKFRVCFRVQEKSDSMEVIKCPDAAYIKNVGRFYLQVGYNEVFVLGQAAYGGVKYVPNDKVQKKLDNSIEFINNIGYPVKKIETKVKNLDETNYGEEIKNIVFHLNQLANNENITTNNLWLDKLPAYININDLKRKYNFIKQENIIDVPIGEYDIPGKQKQALLTVPFSREGNVLVYGSTGSGKENFITTLLHSSITSYTPTEAIYYVIDYGSEALKSFEGFPQVGDVVLQGETEKTTNLFKLILGMLEERKKLFSNYGGNYKLYIEKSKNKIPSVIIIINNYDSYIENNSEYDELLNQITREGPKYGMYLVITVSNPNLIRTKLRQNFKLCYVLQQNNESDYSNILGNVQKFYPSKIFGRGIIKTDAVYEFQTAMVAEQGKIFDYIEQIKPMVIENSKMRANEVPTLPEVVKKSDVVYGLSQDGSIAVGIEKNSLNIAKYDLKNNYISLILSYDVNYTSSFINNMIAQLIDLNYYNIGVMNCENIDLFAGNYTCIDKDYDSIFDRICEFVMINNERYIENNYDKQSIAMEKMDLWIIIGFDAFKNKLSPDNQLKLASVFEKGKDLGLINYIFVDTPDKLRKYEFDSWYKTVINNSKGIFIGNGIADQSIIKIAKVDRNLREDIPGNFCYVVNHGKAALVKYIEKYDE